MKRFALALAFLAMITMASFAQEESKEDCCEKGKCDGACSVEAAMAQLPQMKFKVGDKIACCMGSAEAMAKSSGESVLYVVSDDEFSEKSEAMGKLADVTEAFVNKFVTPTSCKVSGTTTLAGQMMSCDEGATALANEMKEAMDSVQLVYKVGDETCVCPNQASALAEKAGTKPELVVGEESTCCSVEARIKLAHQKFKAAMKVFAAAQHPVEDTKPVGTTS